MSRLYDRAAGGCQPINAALLHREGKNTDEVRSEFVDALTVDGAPPDPAAVDAEINKALTNARAAAATEHLTSEDLAGAVVFAADDVGRYWSSLPQGTNIGDLVEAVVPPYDRTWIEFQGAPNDLNARAWGVLLELMWPADEAVDVEFPWAVRARIVIEWTKNRPVGPVATYAVPLTAEGHIAPGDSEGGTAMSGWLPTLPGMEDWEERRWANHIGPRYLGAALFALSLMHCKNVDWVDNAPPAKVARQRQRRTGRPATRYWTLDIAPMRRILDTDGDAQHSGLRQALHICRGHFKTYGPDAPLFGQHTGTYWWPSHARGDRHVGEVIKDYRVRVDYGDLGQPYRPADEHPEIHTSSESPGRDPDLAGRGLAAHARIQNELAALIAAAGHRPLSPRPSDPQFDLAFDTADTVWLIEVKSLTRSNEETQLRMGFAQLKRYRQLLDLGGREIRCILAVEQPPADTTSDRSWVALCREEGIDLVWPATFDQVIEAV